MYQNFLAILKDRSAPVEKKKKSEKKILECIIYTEMNKQVPTR